MKIANKLFPIIFVFIALSLPNLVSASTAFPKIKLPCDETEEVEFHSLRPYQAAKCGDANKAYFCSNDLIFIETFDVLGMNDCRASGRNGRFTCHPDAQVDPHTLYIQLDNSMLPILGNTEQVINGNGGTEVIDDATKVNEYASWYLSGVNNRAEYGENTNERVVNYSGPLQKLLPKTIQESERKITIEEATNKFSYTDDETQEKIDEPLNHDQIVVCFQKEFLWLFGKSIPKPCSEAGSGLRLSSWKEDLSFLRGVSNLGVKILDSIPDWMLGLVGGAINNSTTVAWNKRFPPLPWDDGTAKYGQTPIPFKTELEYKKAYNEWQGKSCVIIVGNLLCIENPTVTNTYADLYQYVPLSSTTDKKGAEWISDVQFRPTAGTSISGQSHGDELVPAALWMAHTEEVRDLSETLNKTYQPKDFESVPLGKSTEPNKCSVANVRTNEGDNLFPGDPLEMQVPDVTYHIDEAICEEKIKEPKCVKKKGTERRCDSCMGDQGPGCWEEQSSISCTAEVYITLKTGTKTPNATEIFKQTVADSGSTFRKIFPKIESGAPVECIANIPTVTNVDYDTSQTQIPSLGGRQGEIEFKYKKIPEDGAGEGAELTFPHIGSVYEYFLKGIQTALRPKGYGEPITDGTLCEPAEEEVKCKEDVPDSAVDSKYLGQFKDNFIDLANRWSAKCPGEENNMAKQCYNFVASEAKKAGVNPAFALTIWLNESGASNYCEGGETTQDMGINIPAIYQNLAEQIKIFNNMAKMKLCDGMAGFTEPMHGWLSRFQSSSGVCDPSDTTASNYYYAVKDETWSYLTTCANNGKFGITWPTDTSCP